MGTANLVPISCPNPEHVVATALDGHASGDGERFPTGVATKVTMGALGLLDGYGYLRDYPLDRMARDARGTQIVEGTNEVQLIIARERFQGTPMKAAAGSGTHYLDQ